MVRFTLKQCAYFLAVADQGGIAQAARALNISQPAVAQALDKLEALCDLRLFVRHHARGTELTPRAAPFTVQLVIFCSKQSAPSATRARSPPTSPARFALAAFTPSRRST